MGSAPCSVPSCKRPVYARTYCKQHYNRWRTTGQVQPDVPIRPQYLWPESLYRRLRFCPPATMSTGCIEFTGHIAKNGYGGIRVGRARVLAHRAVYELLVGPIPSGLTIDHLCRNKRCVNPGHLEPATLRDNILRSDSPSAVNARKTHCPRGHEYTPENTYLNPAHRGGRVCRACTRSS